MVIQLFVSLLKHSALLCSVSCSEKIAGPTTERETVVSEFPIISEREEAPLLDKSQTELG